MTTFAQMGFAATVTACSATPATDGYIGTLNGLPYHIHPVATPEQWAALEASITAGEVTVDPYVAPTVTPPTLAQQAGALLAGGLAITSTSTPTLNATYPCDSTTQSHVQAEVISILLNGAFVGGGTTLAWPDASGAVHQFSLAAFKAFATAQAAFVAAGLAAQAGLSSTLPPASAAIA